MLRHYSRILWVPLAIQLLFILADVIEIIATRSIYLSTEWVGFSQLSPGVTALVILGYVVEKGAMIGMLAALTVALRSYHREGFSTKLTLLAALALASFFLLGPGQFITAMGTRRAGLPTGTDSLADTGSLLWSTVCFLLAFLTVALGKAGRMQQEQEDLV